MLRFSATAVECFLEFDEVLTVHFDNGVDHSLTLQVWTDGFEQNAVGLGMVHVEVDDHVNSGYDCLTSAELRRDSFRITFTDEEQPLARLEAVEVAFALGAAEFEQLRAALDRVFRVFRANHPIQSGTQ